jgi:hypothetical protein
VNVATLEGVPFRTEPLSPFRRDLRKRGTGHSAYIPETLITGGIRLHSGAVTCDARVWSSCLLSGMLISLAGETWRPVITA